MSADTDKHCRHCEDGCRGGTPIPAWPTPQPHINDDGAEWPEKCCPACAVADLIDAELRPLPEGGDIGWKRIGLTLASYIARGER